VPPGTDVSRRDFVKATGTVGVAGLADCTVGYRRPAQEQAAQDSDDGGDLPLAGPPEVADVTEQDDRVTLRSVTSTLPVHPSPPGRRWAARSSCRRCGRSRPTTAH